MDNSTIIKVFTKRLTIKFLVLGAICAAVFYFVAQQFYFTFVPIIFIYFYLLNFLVFYILVNSHNLPSGQFSKRFMVVTLIKFFGSLAFALLYMIFSRDNIIPFLVIFVILYFSTLIQLVREFLNYLKEKKLS